MFSTLPTISRRLLARIDPQMNKPLFSLLRLDKQHHPSESAEAQLLVTFYFIAVPLESWRRARKQRPKRLLSSQFEAERVCLRRSVPVERDRQFIHNMRPCSWEILTRCDWKSRLVVCSHAPEDRNGLKVVYGAAETEWELMKLAKMWRLMEAPQKKCFCLFSSETLLVSFASYTNRDDLARVIFRDSKNFERWRRLLQYIAPFCQKKHEISPMVAVIDAPQSTDLRY